MFAPAKLLRKWCEQRPSNQGGIDSSAVGEVGRAYLHVDGIASDLIFVSLFWGCVLKKVNFNS
jgi:hypothetical protein